MHPHDSLIYFRASDNECLQNVRLGSLVSHWKFVHVFILPTCMLFYRPIYKILKMYKLIPSDVCKSKLSGSIKHGISNSPDILSSDPCHNFKVFNFFQISDNYIFFLSYKKWGKWKRTALFYY